MHERARESDESLVERAQGGDGTATDELLLRHKSEVRALARRYFLAGGETEDLVQEGMIGLFFAIDGYNPASGVSFKNFFRLLVKRRIYDAVRATSKKSAPPPGNVLLFDPSETDFIDGSATPEESLLVTEQNAEFRRGLARELSDFEFRVVIMYLDGMSYAEICEATGRDVKSVDNALARSKRKLKALQRTKENQ